MRHRIREQSYVDPELNRQVRAYEPQDGWTHSAFTREAYENFLAAERGDRGPRHVGASTPWPSGLKASRTPSSSSG